MRRESMLPQTLDNVSPHSHFSQLFSTVVAFGPQLSVHKASPLYRWGFWGSLKDGVWEMTEYCFSVPRQGQATQGSACEFYCYIETIFYDGEAVVSPEQPG